MRRLVHNLILGSLLVFGSLVILPTNAHAQASLTFTNGEDEFAVPTKLITSWQGKFSVPAFTNLRAKTKPLDVLLASFVGLKTREAVNYNNFNYDPAKIYAWISDLSKTIDQKPEEPNLKIENGQVSEFTPPQNGQTLDVYKSTLDAIDALEAKQVKVPLIISKAQPQTSLAGTNDLGINELLAEGVSNFSGSPSNRRHNIAVGAERMRGVIVKPGEEFSFNKYLGPVEAAEGYLPELVIKGAEGTIPELGGGLCQVSTTVFRAAMKAGLPITQRRNHAYAVKYYAPQGTDATIYPGVVDLKFINNTPGSILIWPQIIDTNILHFDFYGTKDGREVTLGTPVQFDKKADGSMKATWERTITLDGETKSETFKSTYQPPALFHKQEQFVPAVPPAGTPIAPTATPPSTPTPATPSITTPPVKQN